MFEQPPGLDDGSVSSPASTSVSPVASVSPMAPVSPVASGSPVAAVSPTLPDLAPQPYYQQYTALANTSPAVVHVVPQSQTHIPRVVKQTNAKTLAKRARNTEAARKSRQRAKSRIQQLEAKINELQKENAALKSGTRGWCDPSHPDFS